MKPWPTDAIMITAAIAGTENQSKMFDPFAASCRDCNAELMVCNRTYQTAKELGERYKKPVMFFCIDCHNKHQVEQCNILVDHRDMKNEWHIR